MVVNDKFQQPIQWLAGLGVVPHSVAEAAIDPALKKRQLCSSGLGAPASNLRAAQSCLVSRDWRQ